MMVRFMESKILERIDIDNAKDRTISAGKQ